MSTPGFTHQKRGESGYTARGHAAQWMKWLSAGLSAGSTCLYIGLYFITPRYQPTEDLGYGLTVFIKVLLNIYQTYLGIFILISVALFILFHVKSLRPGNYLNYLLALIIFNFVIAAVLFGLMVVGPVGHGG
jgi:hypothetical protein